MQIIPASNSLFLPFGAQTAPAGPVFPTGTQPLIYLHHQYGFAADGSEWASRIGTAKATQSNAAKRPTVSAGGLFSDGTKAMQTGTLPLASAPALTVIMAFSMPLASTGFPLEMGADYHVNGAFAFFAENNGGLYSPYQNGTEFAQRVPRSGNPETVIMRLRPTSGSNTAAVMSLQSLTSGYGGEYYRTGVPIYGLTDNVLNLFARNNGTNPAGLALRQVLIFPDELTEAKAAEWIATF